MTWRKEKLLHLYYNKDETKRLLFFRHKDYITAVKERLNIFDEEDLEFASCYGFWEEDDDYHHIYDSLETALNEWQRELTHYKEEPLPLPSSNEETIKFMD